MENTVMKEILVKFDPKTLDILQSEIQNKRARGIANSLVDIFNIRLLEGVKSGMREQTFKLKSHGVAVK